jgi:cysteinyl-tRNA synthetase
MVTGSTRKVIDDKRVDELVKQLDELNVKERKIKERKKKLVREISSIIGNIHSHRNVYTRTHVIYTRSSHGSRGGHAVVIKRRSDKEAVENHYREKFAGKDGGDGE